jgi:chemotaxis methyl-accepting protein methylase
MAALRQWLTTEAATGRHLRCLDAACGSGEGTWELALAARAAGIPRELLSIHGSSLGVLELTAASHLFFPHEPPHQENMRQLFSPLVTDGYGQRLSFFRDDLLNPSPVETPYDLILCNGTIGGPFIHEARQMEAALTGLASRLEKGGMLCMADRFHGGWEKKIPKERIAAALGDMGLSVRVSEDGIAAVKCP